MINAKNDQIIETIELLDSFNYRVIHEEIIDDDKFIRSSYKELILKIFGQINIEFLTVSNRDEIDIYRKLANLCIRKSNLGLRDEAIKSLKKLFFFYLINRQLFDAYISLPSIHVIDRIQRYMLKKIWWDVWLKEKDFGLGMQFIHALPKGRKYERQFIYLLEDRFGKGFNKIDLNSYKDNWFQLPYNSYKFLIWLDKVIALNKYGYKIMRLIDILITDTALKDHLLEKANIQSCEFGLRSNYL